MTSPAASGRTRHASPFHCPYCAEEDLWPVEHPESRSAWECRACLRVFSVQLLETRRTDDVTDVVDSSLEEVAR